MNKKDQYLNNFLKRKYSINLNQYNTLRRNQQYSCAICKIPEDCLKKRLSVDHCHETSIVRGLLCSNCNIGLGNFMDNISLIKAAMYYLIESKSRNTYTRLIPLEDPPEF